MIKLSPKKTIPSPRIARIFKTNTPPSTPRVSLQKNNVSTLLIDMNILRYFKSTVSKDQYHAILRTLDANLPPVQLKALQEIKRKAIFKETDQEMGKKYFYYQYGARPILQLMALFETFRLFPDEILNANLITPFINQAFIDTWDELKKLDPIITTELDLSDKDLYQLPKNILKLIRLRKLYLTGNHCQ